MPDHNYFSNLIWQIADLLRGPYRPPQYERVMLPMTVLRRFDSVLAPTKAKVLAEYEKRKGSKLEGDALDTHLNKAAGQRFHNHSPLDFAKLKGDPDNIEKHLVSYIKGFSKNVRDIFDFFEFEAEIERMREANILYLVVSKFCDVDLHPNTVPNEQMGLIFENLIRRFNELANETAGDHFTPREVIRLMVNILFINDDKLLATPGTVRKLLDPACVRVALLDSKLTWLWIYEHDGRWNDVARIARVFMKEVEEYPAVPSRLKNEAALHLGIALVRTGAPDAGRKLLKTALDHAQRTGRAAIEVRAHFALADSYDDPAQALPHYLNGAAIAARKSVGRYLHREQQRLVKRLGAPLLIAVNLESGHARVREDTMDSYYDTVAAVAGNVDRFIEMTRLSRAKAYREWKESEQRRTGARQNRRDVDDDTIGVSDNS